MAGILECDVCDTITTAKCPACGKIPLCAKCAKDGPCTACVDDDDEDDDDDDDFYGGIDDDDDDDDDGDDEP